MPLFYSEHGNRTEQVNFCCQNPSLCRVCEAPLSQLLLSRRNCLWKSFWAQCITLCCNYTVWPLGEIVCTAWCSSWWLGVKHNTLPKGIAERRLRQESLPASVTSISPLPLHPFRTRGILTATCSFEMDKMIKFLFIWRPLDPNSPFYFCFQSHVFFFILEERVLKCCFVLTVCLPDVTTKTFLWSCRKTPLIDNLRINPTLYERKNMQTRQYKQNYVKWITSSFNT